MSSVFSSEAVEYWAALLALIYLLLAMKEKWLCWPVVIISALLYAWVFFDARLYTEAVFQFFYIGMCVYGWRKWRPHKNTAAEVIKRWPLKFHLLAGASSLALALPVAFLLARYSNASFPYLDSCLTAFSLAATFMVAAKVLENWLYWILIDLISTVLYFYKDLYVSSLLYLLYTVLAVVGYVQWRRLWQLNRVSQ